MSWALSTCIDPTKQTLFYRKTAISRGNNQETFTAGDIYKIFIYLIIGPNSYDMVMKIFGVSKISNDLNPTLTKTAIDKLPSSTITFTHNCDITYDTCTKGGKMNSGDDYSHHPWQGHAFKRTTEDISESLAGLHLALY